MGIEETLEMDLQFDASRFRSPTIPVIMQDTETNTVLDLVWQERSEVDIALMKRFVENRTDHGGSFLVSRFYEIDDILVDCDQDALLYKIQGRNTKTRYAKNLEWLWSDNRPEPVICQQTGSREVLMLGYAAKLAIEISKDLGVAVYSSRSQQKLWLKGGTSRNIQSLSSVLFAPMASYFLYNVQQLGEGACHSKRQDDRARWSCFYRRVVGDRPEFVAD